MVNVSSLFLKCQTYLINVLSIVKTQQNRYIYPTFDWVNKKINTSPLHGMQITVLKIPCHKYQILHAFSRELSYRFRPFFLQMFARGHISRHFFEILKLTFLVPSYDRSAIFYDLFCAKLISETISDMNTKLSEKVDYSSNLCTTMLFYASGAITWSSPRRKNWLGILKYPSYFFERFL